MISDFSKVYRLLEYAAVFLSVLSVVFLFLNFFFSLFFAGISAVISSVGMMVYVLKSDKLMFSKMLMYSLLISSVPLIIIFFKMLK